jgi:Ser/Thr protein kinase RdoA (MazF antagonist)
VLEAASARLAPEQLAPTGHPLWTVAIDSTLGVLHRYPPHRAADDVAWEHAFLHALARTGFPAPRPLHVWSGESHVEMAGGLWGMLQYLPGRSLAWEREPAMVDVGRFIAQFHEAVRGIAVPARVSVPTLRQASESYAARRPVIEMSEEKLARLEDVAHATWQELREHDPMLPLLIHGDLTNDNVLIDGTPPRAVGLIDFAMAHLDVPLAELAGNLWRSGRAEHAALALDPQRVRDLMRGYASRAPLARAEADLLPAYLIARGLQLIQRWAARRGPEALRITARRILAIADQADELRSAARSGIA